MSSFNLKPTIVNGGTFNVGNMGVGSGSSKDYDVLYNKPSINGVTLEGNKTSEELNIVSDKEFIYTQSTSSDVWMIQHNLNKYPSVTVVDSGNSVVAGEVIYIDKNNVRITFTSAFSGKAYFN